MASGVPSRADFFTEQAHDVAYEGGAGGCVPVPLAYHVGNVLNAGSPLIFHLPHIDKAAINFQASYLRFRIRIRTNAGAAIGNNPRPVYPTNGIAHTLWKNIELLANGVPTTNSYQPYSYKKIIEHLLTADESAAHMHKLWGYKKRVSPPGQGAPHAISRVDRDTQRGQPHFENDNPNLRNWTEFIMTPALDLFSCATNIVSLPTVKWELRLTPHDPVHSLNWSVDWGANLAEPDNAGVADSLADNYRIEIDVPEVTFHMRKEILTDSAYAAAMDVAKNSGGFMYNYTPTVIKTKTLQPQTMGVEMSDYSPRANPLMLAHTFVLHDAYNGAKRYNPYFFSPPETLAKFYNYFNGQVLGEQSPVNLANGAGRPHLYHNNMSALGIDDQSKGLYFDQDQQDKGFWFKITTLAPSSDSPALAPKTSSGIHTYKVELNGHAALPYTIITYIIYEQAKIIINLDGTVTNTFSPQ